MLESRIGRIRIVSTPRITIDPVGVTPNEWIALPNFDPKELKRCPSDRYRMFV